MRRATLANERNGTDLDNSRTELNVFIVEG
jgi:hypothetical protein